MAAHLRRRQRGRVDGGVGEPGKTVCVRLGHDLAQQHRVVHDREVVVQHREVLASGDVPELACKCRREARLTAYTKPSSELWRNSVLCEGKSLSGLKVSDSSSEAKTGGIDEPRTRSNSGQRRS